MKCQSCGQTTRINWGDANIVLCEACYDSKSGKEPAKPNSSLRTSKTEKITDLERIDDLEEREHFHKAEGKTIEPRHPKPNESNEGNKFSMDKLGTVFWVAAATVLVSIVMSNMKSKELALAGVVAGIGFIVFVRPLFRSYLSRESLKRDIDTQEKGDIDTQEKGDIDTQEDERHVPDLIHTVIVYAPMIVSGILAKFVGDTMQSVTDSPERAIVLLPGLIVTSWLAYTREISAWFIPFLISVAGIAYCLWVFYVGDWSNLPNAPYFFGF